MAFTDLESRRFGRDLFLPEGDGVLQTAAGDWPHIEGRPNLHASIRRRMATSPGRLTHRPEYGAGLQDYLEVASKPAVRSKMANRAAQNARQDPRIRHATATAALGVPGDTSVPDTVTIEMRIQPQTDDVQELTVIVE